jgi:heme exporter protein D
MWSFVGASLLAMVVNDNAYLLAKRGALESIASKLAPTISLTERHPAAMKRKLNCVARESALNKCEVFLSNGAGRFIV